MEKQTIMEAFERIQNGENRISVANSYGNTLTVLYNAFVEEGLIEVVRPRTIEISTNTYKEYLELFKKKLITIREVAEDLDVSHGTVFNNFIKLGYTPSLKMTKRKSTPITLSAEDEHLSVNELALKHDCTPTHIRYLIRKAKKDL